MHPRSQSKVIEKSFESHRVSSIWFLDRPSNLYILLLLLVVLQISIITYNYWRQSQNSDRQNE